MIKKVFLSALLVIISLFVLPASCRAEVSSSRSAITVMNPVRGNGLGHEGEDLLASLKLQWNITKEAGVNATWLFQYGALEDDAMTEFAKEDMSGQEFGLLFEIDRRQAGKAGVQFRGQGPWYGSDGLFLNSYDQTERRNLIDKAFGKFKSVFGYYPKTVGAWWIGGDSLSYMQKTYGITAALRAADQFQLDAYSIWGTPWDIPYLASSVNEGMPGASVDESAKVVLLQWAIRDPLRGYSDPLYSLQDYSMKGYTKDYVDYLSSVFLQQPLGNMVIGLENGGAPGLFEGSYRTMLTNAKEMAGKYDADLLSAKEYSQNYLAAKKVFAAKTYVLADDYGSNNQSFWYMSQEYRIAVHRVEGSVSVVDLRDYSVSLEEDFRILPNTQPTLRINEPSFIDSMRFPGESIVLRSNAEPLRTEEADGGITLFSGREQLAFFTPAALTLYPEKTGEMKISFERKQPVSVVPFLCILYAGYFIVIYAYRKNAVQSLRDIALLSLPLLFAYPFLTSAATFLFDKKELPLLAALSLFPFRSILLTLYVSKLLPFVLLFISHYVFILRPSGKTGKIIYTIIFVLTVLLYAHLPYFPLDRTTYPAVFLCLGILSLCVCIPAAAIAWKKKTKKIILLCILAPLMFIASCILVVLLSRTKLALTLFELNALSTIKNQPKNVIYEEEVDFGVLPVYKAVKPLLYKNYRLGEIMTGKIWRVVERPENNVLTLSDYDNDIIVVPRYLGSDLSGYEMEVLNLRKIFDNAQIAIFEKK